ncbi:biotin/lipoyl-containing protein [Rhodoferax sp.]|uniref:biotin/lipoyl-containing protein n=1 Tax=Rhodoferax sp. TaxID=50421 RepID=UPI00272F1254|nr:acetyl-CoA carboxylase biotin carboxyl carrier protein subunit [Rhodoferax sp.]MDP1530047.1 biotin/lipoyl-containing protein [Rhodoferax sp.]MDP1945717.1 biotin/lipoyl-containing protein [Rhodoferax sp.]MDP2442214.1 biotin/lipoyl-containing protein [Rhodoferax sp.]MDZ4206857.1 biotin/lipoyl-containing protein [Rhodoferax sp.]
MKLRITLDDKTFEVEVEVAEADHASLPPAYPVGSARLTGSAAAGAPTGSQSGAGNPPAVADEGKACRSPVSGVVVKVVAAAGASINAGDSILILEAMKMETNITAPVSGVIAEIKVAQGDRVQTGDVLVEFI